MPNQLVHPYVLLEWNDHLEKIGGHDKNATTIVAVPLFRTINRRPLFDVTVLLLASQEDQLHRLMARNNLTREDAQKRINRQMPLEQKNPSGRYCYC